MVGRGAVNVLQDRISGAVSTVRQTKFLVQWQSLRQHSSQKISTAWSSTLVCAAQLRQQQSEACLCYTLEGHVLHPSGPLNKYFETLDKLLENSWWAYPAVLQLYRCVCSGHTCRNLEHSTLPDMN